MRLDGVAISRLLPRSHKSTMSIPLSDDTGFAALRPTSRCRSIVKQALVCYLNTCQLYQSLTAVPLDDVVPLDLSDQIEDLALTLSNDTSFCITASIRINITFMSFDEDAMPVPDPELDVLPCCICFDDIAGGEDVQELPCDHMFHDWCIREWFRASKKTCPVCRADHSDHDMLAD